MFFKAMALKQRSSVLDSVWVCLHIARRLASREGTFLDSPPEIGAQVARRTALHGVLVSRPSCPERSGGNYWLHRIGHT